MKNLSNITYRALNRSKGIAEKVAYITVSFAVISIVVSMSIASGFRSELTSVILEKEGDYWLECRDSSLTAKGVQLIDSQLIEELYYVGVSKVEPRISSPIVILSDEGALPLEVRSLDMPVSDSSTFDGIIISSNLARKLNVEVGDKIDVVYSMKLPFTFQISVDSVYDCGIKELSESIGYCSFVKVSEFRGVDPGYVDGYVLWGGDFDAIADIIYPKQLWMYDSQDRFSSIFDWLNVIDGNVWIVVSIMIVVAIINMMAASLSIILENTKSIAVLKSIGMPMSSIRRGLLIKNLWISIKGALSGLIIAVILCALQYYLHIFKLPSSDYMVDYVPIFLDIVEDLIVTMLSVLIISSMTMFVTIIIDNIKEDKILRYE